MGLEEMWVPFAGIDILIYGHFVQFSKVYEFFVQVTK